MASRVTKSSAVAQRQQERKFRQRAKQKNGARLPGRLLVVGGRGDLEHGEEGFLRNVDLADALHAALAFFLLFEEFTLARDVSSVALGENIFADSREGFAGDDT